MITFPNIFQQKKNVQIMNARAYSTIAENMRKERVQPTQN